MDKELSIVNLMEERSTCVTMDLDKVLPLIGYVRILVDGDEDELVSILHIEEVDDVTMMDLCSYTDDCLVRNNIMLGQITEETNYVSIYILSGGGYSEDELYDALHNYNEE